jgi:hypothetical protein
MLQLEFHNNCSPIGQPINHSSPARRSRQSVRRSFWPLTGRARRGSRRVCARSENFSSSYLSCGHLLPECHKKKSKTRNFCGKNRIPIDRRESQRREEGGGRGETVRENNCAVIIGSMSNGKNGKAETPKKEPRRMEILLNSSSRFLRCPRLGPLRFQRSNEEINSSKISPRLRHGPSSIKHQAARRFSRVIIEFLNRGAYIRRAVPESRHVARSRAEVESGNKSIYFRNHCGQSVWINRRVSRDVIYGRCQVGELLRSSTTIYFILIILCGGETAET